jgi:hypothetical protein
MKALLLLLGTVGLLTTCRTAPPASDWIYIQRILALPAGPPLHQGRLPD